MEARAGAAPTGSRGGQVGFTEFLKTAKPDGYTVFWALLPAVPSNYLDPKRKATFTRKEYNDYWADCEKTVKAVLDATSK